MAARPATAGSPNYDYTQPPSKTKYAEQLPYLTELISQYFNLKYLNFARLAIINNSVLIPHRDLLELGAVPAHARNVHRIHVPLITHDNCYFWEENIVYQMRFGEAWFLDASRAHSAASLSEQDRVHLMLDFPDVENASQLIRFKKDDREEISPESIQARSALTEAERRELLALANVIDIDNFKNIFSIVIKKHYCKDGGAIIGAIGRRDFSAEASPERPLMLSDPRLDVRELVVPLGNDEGQPNDRHPSEAQARPIAVGWEMSIQ